MIIVYNILPAHVLSLCEYYYLYGGYLVSKNTLIQHFSFLWLIGNIQNGKILHGLILPLALRHHNTQMNDSQHFDIQLNNK